MAIDFREPKIQKIFLGAVAGAAVLYAYFFTEFVPFTYKANATELKTLEEKYRDLSKDLTKARQAAHQLPYLEQEFGLLHRKWEQGQSMLPEKVEMTVLLRTLTLIGTQAGIEFVKFKPMPAAYSTNYTENPIEIEVVGGYHQVGSFLSEIANLDRIINVRDLEVGVNKDKDHELDKPSHAAFVAVAYTVGQAPPPPSPETGKVGKGKAKGAKKDEAKGAEGKKSESKGKGKAKAKAEASDE
ncbi:MAG: type 4a pilus biogenesis protein PilO [Candidatus Eisenbacteria bacterium]|nr:type 4a pilus biogenesis protein PilO [Candidatus Eisenbacteria bacterium]